MDDKPEDIFAKLRESDPWRLKEAEWRRLRVQGGSFAGIAAPLLSVQERLTAQFRDAAQVSHPGDKGAAREHFLRRFLRKKYLPARFGISKHSSHVISTDGGTSAQCDVVLYDAMNAPRLLNLGRTLYFPHESVFGVIEVKSDLNSVERVTQGLENLASFKGLRPADDWDAPGHGFGILFAYSASLRFESLVAAVESWQSGKPSRVWPNLVVVLNQGCLLQTNGERVALENPQIEELHKPSIIHTSGDNTLLNFYLLLVDLLTSTKLPPLEMRKYVDLPEKVDGRSVYFELAPKLQIHDCRKHGAALRQLNKGVVDRIVNVAAHADGSEVLSTAHPAHAPGYRLTGEDPVAIYNPDCHDLQQLLFLEHDLLVRDGTRYPWKRRLYDVVYIDSWKYWIPSYYSYRESLITGCQKCGSKFAPGLSLDAWKLELRTLLEAPEEGTSDG